MKGLTTTLIGILIAFCVKAQTANQQLVKAVKIGNAGIAEQLLKAGADANYVESNTNFKVDLLILAVINQDVPMVRLLVEHKADVNWHDGYGDTALMYAAQLGNIDLINYLLNNRADIHAKDNKGNTVLSAAREGKHPDAIALIASRLK